MLKKSAISQLGQICLFSRIVRVIDIIQLVKVSQENDIINNKVRMKVTENEL